MKNNIKNYPNYNVDKNGVITNIITNKMIKKRKNNKEKIRDVYADYKDQITFKGFEQIWFGYTWKHLVEKVEG